MRPSGSGESVVPSALADVAKIGPFFAVSTNPAEAIDDSWRPLREFYGDPEAIKARIRTVAEALTISNSRADRRIAASIAYQGLAARLVSPALAVAAVHGLLPSWSPDTLYWRPWVVGSLPLWCAVLSPDGMATPPADSADPDERVDSLAEMVADSLVGPHLAALAASVRAESGVSMRILWGNAASALVAAGRLIATSRPAAANRARRLVARVIDSGPLAGAGSLGPGWRFRRASCCLYYRVPGGGTCGDCVLARS